MAGELTGKVAVVTGASRGIGEGIALAFGRAGAHVVVIGRTIGDEPGGTIDQTALAIGDAGGSAIALVCDVTREASVTSMMQAAADWHGRIDVLVNNAGTLIWDGLLGTPPDVWQRIIRTNLDGPSYCTMAALPYLRRRGGAIINLSSGRADSADEHATAYAASKAALDRLTIKLAAEVRADGVAVNGLRPGPVLTPGVLASNGGDLTPFVPVDDPRKKILPACLYLAAHAADPAHFFSGHIVSEADFGVTWPPALVGGGAA